MVTGASPVRRDERGRNPSKLDKSHIRKFKDALLAKGLSAANTKKQLGVVRTVLGWAEENSLVEHNMAARVGVRDARVQREARLPYADADLKVIVSSPV